ncbi:MAG: glycosyltransferase [Gemmatimonadaceae bacterium]
MHVIDSLARGGAERMLVDIANATAADGVQVSVCVTRSGLDLVDSLYPTIRLHVMDRRWRFDVPGLVRFVKLLRSAGVGLLHAHSRPTLSLLAFCRALGGPRVPIVVQDHFGGIHRDNSIPRWFRWSAGRYVAHYVGVCEELGAWALRAGMPGDRITVIENALDLGRVSAASSSSVRAEFHLDQDCLVGVVVGGVRPDKGLDVLLEALARVPATQPFKILVVGKEQDVQYARECRQKVRDLRLDDRIVFTGERRDAAALMRGADFAVIPSRSESGPLVLIECLASNLPVVWTLTGGVAQRAAALCVPGSVAPGSSVALGDGLRALLALSDEERRARGELGGRIAREQFSIKAVMPRWYQVYERALTAGV